MKVQRILLTTDFSECAQAAYPTCAMWARRNNAQVDLIRCVDYPFQYPFAGIEGGDDAYTSFRLVLAQKLAAERKLPIFKGIRVEAHLLEGFGAEAICRFAEEHHVDLILQASHGHSGVKRLLLGSFAEEILRTSPVPVLTIRPPEHPGDLPLELSPTKILFPYDFSECSRAALPALRHFASEYGAKVHLLHVLRLSPESLVIPGITGEPVDHDFLRYFEKHPTKTLEELKDMGKKELPDIAWEAQVAVGSPATTIAEKARELQVDLICMATHGWRGFKRFVVGSVAEGVIRASHCPTLMVRRASQPAVVGAAHQTFPEPARS